MKIDEKYLDIIKEFINIGMGSSAQILNQMTNSHITLGVPELNIIDYKQLSKKFNHLHAENIASINMPFDNDLQGVANLIFPSSSAAKLVDMFVGNLGDVQNLDAMRASALTEIGNIIINTVIGSISNQINIKVDYTIPDYKEGKFTDVIEFEQIQKKQIILFCLTEFKALDYNISGNLLLFFKIEKFNNFLCLIDSYYNNISSNA